MECFLLHIIEPMIVKLFVERTDLSIHICIYWYVSDDWRFNIAWHDWEHMKRNSATIENSMRVGRELEEEWGAVALDGTAFNGTVTVV